MEKETLVWHAPEFEYREKGSDWYWILGIVALFGAIISVVLHNILFAVLIIISAFLMAMFGSKQPELIDYEISKRGLRAENKLYTFGSLESFWIDNIDETNPKLLLTSKSTFALHISIPIPEELEDDIHDFLLSRIHEVEQAESFVERIMSWIKF